jgi:hypothetical protein
MRRCAGARTRELIDKRLCVAKVWIGAIDVGGECVEQPDEMLFASETLFDLQRDREMVAD